MIRRITALLLALLCFCALDRYVFGCTTFCLKDNGEMLFGKNYDWDIDDGLVFVNKRGVAKISGLENEKNPAKWVSKYGSVTFNQYGWESPSGGMNEMGLAIELMWLDGTEYPKPDSRPAIDVLEWIQFQLDTSATTAEVIRNSETVRIASEIDLHYLVNDRLGNTATIEFLNGKLVAHTGRDLPVAALTNDTYTRSVDFAEKHDPASTRSASSLDRFVRASARTKAFGQKPLSEMEAIDYAFETLAIAAQPSTQWSIVYDQKRMRIHFRTRSKSTIKTLDASSFDYGCASPVMILDMNGSASGEVSTMFKPYSRKANRELIQHSFNGTSFLTKVPDKIRDFYAEFPERFTCSSVEPLKDKGQKTAEALDLTIVDLAFPICSFYKRFASSQ